MKYKLLGEAEAEVGVVVVRRVVAAVRHAAVPRAEVPAAATEHAERAGTWTLVVCAPYIGCPFPDVAAHIVDT